MTGYGDIATALAREHLLVLGGVPINAPEPTLQGFTRSLLLIGPDNAQFWPHFSASREYGDATQDPLDRWSKRVLSQIAARFGGAAVFPSDGPPYPPFYDWALRSGAFAISPLRMLVHPRDGLMTSLRGALALPRSVVLAAPIPSPCTGCEDRPCLTACPVSAFDSGEYDVVRCHNHLDTPAGSDCMVRGCAARRACPVSAGSGRDPAQSAFHMRAFHGTK